MITCRYVGGGCSSIGEREFDSIGQKAVLSEQGFCEAILGGAAFIPEASFEKLCFTSDELTAFGTSGTRVDPPDVFSEKLEIARQIYVVLRHQMGVDSKGTLAEISN